MTDQIPAKRGRGRPTKEEQAARALLPQKIVRPAVFSCRRSMDVTNGVLSYGHWSSDSMQETWQPLLPTSQIVRGTYCNDPVSNVAQDVVHANIQKKEVCMLPLADDFFQSPDALRLQFNVKFQAFRHAVSACNDGAYFRRFSEKLTSYANDEGFRELSTRYAKNLINGCSLWENKKNATSITTYITYNNETLSFSNPDHLSANESNHFELLVSAIQKNLLGVESFHFGVSVIAKLFAGAEVFPSQIIKQGEYAHALSRFFILGKTVGITQQKISNALRTVDDWHEEGFPIPADPLPCNTFTGIRYRRSGNDFYCLLDRWLNHDFSLTEGDIHYIVSVIIRGGIFGGGSSQ